MAVNGRHPPGVDLYDDVLTDRVRGGIEDGIGRRAGGRGKRSLIVHGIDVQVKGRIRTLRGQGSRVGADEIHLEDQVAERTAAAGQVVVEDEVPVGVAGTREAVIGVGLPLEDKAVGLTLHHR